MSRVNTTTNKRLDAGIVDQILNSNVFATRMLTSAKQWKGEKIRKSIKVEKNTNGGSFDGFDTFSTNAVDNRQVLEFDARFYEKGVTIPFTDLAKNAADPTRIEDLAAAESESTAEDMADDIGTQFYSDGTGNGGKDFLGLEGIVDDGTNVATYGGLARATYGTLDSTVTASGGTLTLAKLDTLYDAIASGSVKPTAIYCSETIFSLYGQLLQPQERIMKDVGVMKGITGGTGFTALSYRGIPVLADEKATSGVLYMVNENFLEWRAINFPQVTGAKPINFSVKFEGNDYTNVKGLGFQSSDWIIPSNQGSVIKHIYLGGELWSSNPKRQGKLTGITGV